MAKFYFELIEHHRRIGGLRFPLLEDYDEDSNLI